MHTINSIIPLPPPVKRPTKVWYNMFVYSYGTPPVCSSITLPEFGPSVGIVERPPRHGCWSGFLITPAGIRGRHYRPAVLLHLIGRPPCGPPVVYLHIIDVYVIHHGAVSKHDEWDPVSCTRRCAVCTLLESMASRQGSVCGPDQTRAEAANTNMCAHSIVILLDQEEVFQWGAQPWRNQSQCQSFNTLWC